VILLDDCSTDDSCAILEEYRTHPKTAAFVVNEHNSGSPFAQWRKGAALAKGRYIWIAESDDFCALNFLETAAQALRNGAQLFYAKSINVNEAGEQRGDENKWYADLSADKWKSSFTDSAAHHIESYLAFKNVINNASAVVFTNDARLPAELERVQHMKYCGDWIFWLRALRGWSTVAYSTDTVNYFRFHGKTSRSDSKFVRNDEVWEVLKTVLELQRDEERSRSVIRYFFSHHFGIYPRRNIAGNLAIRSKQVQLHPYFRKLWRQYYLSGVK
jgi:glycosyltransferase involved in cell wall biosynthesis